MVIELVKLKAEHLEQLVSQEYMTPMRPFITPDLIKSMEASDNSYTVITATGRIAACGGIRKYWEGRGEAWAIFDMGNSCKREFLAIHNAVKKVLSECGFKRIECTVELPFKAGHRWARLLGFNLEASVMGAYLPGGKDASLYARVS
jgi:hypothetical protein